MVSESGVHETLLDYTAILKVSLQFAGRKEPIDLEIKWDDTRIYDDSINEVDGVVSMPPPIPGEVVEEMQSGNLNLISGESVAWDDGSVIFMTVGIKSVFVGALHEEGDGGE